MLNATQGFTYNKFEKPNDWPKIDKTFDYKIENGKLLSGNEHIYLSGPVTYTKVGNPTIVDGIANGFSGSDYLTTPSQTQDINICEWNLKFNTLTVPSTNGFILGYKVNNGVIVTASKKIRVAWEDSTSTRVEKELNYVLSDDTDYVLNCVFNNTNSTATITLKNSGGTALITETYSKVSYKKLDNYFWIGMRGGSSYTNNYFRGSVDLNETYIKVNDRLWFYGKNYTTKDKVPVPAGLEYNNTTTPSIGWVNTNTDRVKGPVNYTTVGSPTIVDGVASGFSSSNYFSLPNLSSSRYNTIEIGTKIKTGNEIVDAAIIGETNWYVQGILIAGTEQKTIQCRCNLGSYKTASSGVVAQPNTEYTIKAIIDKTNGSVSIQVNNAEPVTTTFTVTAERGIDYRLGGSGTIGYFTGSIDLNNTYIKVNGQPWFGNCPSEFQQFTPAPKGTMIGKDDTHSLAVETYQDKGTVDYTIVGSPTIVDGVVSNFSSSNYLTLPGSVSTAQDFEIVGGINLNTSSPSGSYIPIFQSNGYGVIFCVTTAMKLGAYLSSTGTSWDLATSSSFVGTTTLSTNTNYLVKLKKTSTAYELWLKQGNNDWNLEATLNSTATIISGPLRIGYGSRAFDGSIDLNETYIKVNGQYWFHPYPNSYPKLVGPADYTLSGDATVTNGILSNIVTSPSSSCVTPSLPEEYSTLEFMFNVGYSRQFNAGSYIPVAAFNAVNSPLRINANGSVGHRLYYTSSDSDYITEISTSEFDIISAVNQAGGYYIKLLVQKNEDAYTYTLGCSTDKQNWITKTANSSVQICKGLVSLLRSATGASAGRPQMNLNNTYIKVNDALWFGKEDWIPSTYTDNAIYLLGSHNTDYSNYNTQGINPTIETESDESGTYNVWIDNQEIYKEQSNPLDINWSNLALTTGYDITTPSTLKAHVIKVEPNNGNITRFSADTNYKVENGLLTWASPKLYLEGPTQYTVVGSPTIVDGVASGFSSSNYLQLTQNPSYAATDEIEWNTSFTTSSSIATEWVFAFNDPVSSAMRGIYYVASRVYVLYCSGKTLDLTYSLQANTTYSVNFKKDSSGNLTALLKDENGNILKTATQTDANVAMSYNTRRIGLGFSTGNSGSIDLNQTYIKVNGNLWFGKIYTSETDVPVPANFTYGNTTTSSNGTVNLTTQEFSADTLATYGKDS